MKKIKNIILWSLMRLFSKRPWFKSTDGGIIQPDKGTISRFFYDALRKMYYPKATQGKKRP